VFFRRDTRDYVPRQGFFKGTRFLVSPTAMERERGYLIPGHRFIPFVQRYQPPCNYTVLDPDGKPLEFRQVTLSMEEIQVYYSLFDYSRTIEFLVMEDERNADVLLKGAVNPSERVTLWVLDLPELRTAPDLVYDMTCVNWRDGIFQMQGRTLDTSPAYEARVAEWCAHLETMLSEKVFQMLGPMTDVHEQVAQAFFLGDAVLTRKPLVHLGGFLARLHSIQFARVNGVPLFWRLGQSPEDEIFEQLRPQTPLVGTKDSLNGILHDVGSSLRETELEAYMRDSLFQGRPSFEEAMERALRHRGGLRFTDSEQEEAFHDEAIRLWDFVSENYNRFSDQRAGKCRTECLAIMDDVVLWMNKLDAHNIGMDALPKKEFVAISSLVTMISHTVSALNQGPDQISSEEITALSKALDPLRTQAEQLMAAIEAKIFPPKNSAPHKRPVFRVIQGGLEDK